MPFENIPWAVTGGKSSAAAARMVAYQATSGEEGVATFGDLVVRQLAVAGGSVRIGPGGFAALNRYPGAKGETYIGRAGDETTLAVPPNAGTTTRYDLVIARIDDWNMPGGQATPDSLPTDSVSASYPQVITNVAASTKTAAQLGLNYPAIALARIAVPAATSAITQAMITDLREVAVPRRKRDLRAVGQVPGRNNSLLETTAGGEQFPNDGVFTVEIPYWATRMRFKHDLGGIYLPANGQAYADIWVRIGHGRADAFNAQSTRIDVPAQPAGSRIDGFSADDVAIPAAMRGQSILILLMGRKLSAGSAALLANESTAMALDMEFLEAPTEDL